MAGSQCARGLKRDMLRPMPSQALETKSPKRVTQPRFLALVAARVYLYMYHAHVYLDAHIFMYL